MQARDLPLLAVFAAVIRHGSFTAAAKALELSKSLVSENIRQLEERCGVRLIERSTRKLRLTQVGEQVLGTATAISEAARSLDTILEEHRNAPVGMLRIATTHDLGSLLVAPVAARLAVLHPQMTVDIVSDDLSQDLIASRIDVAVRLGVPRESGNVVRPLALIPEPIVAAPALAASYSGVSRPRELAGAPWARHSLVSRSDSLTFRGPKGETDTVPLTLRAQSNTGEGVRALLLSGVGIGVLPEYMVIEELRRGALVRLCPGWIWKQVTLYAELPSAKRKPRRSQLFLEALIATISATGTEGRAGTIGWKRWTKLTDNS
jgi:DNA-binding transcriptional LysR family regulator